MFKFRSRMQHPSGLKGAESPTSLPFSSFSFPGFCHEVGILLLPVLARVGQKKDGELEFGFDCVSAAIQSIDIQESHHPVQALTCLDIRCGD